MGICFHVRDVFIALSPANIDLQHDADWYTHMFTRKSSLEDVKRLKGSELRERTTTGHRQHKMGQCVRPTGR